MALEDAEIWLASETTCCGQAGRSWTSQTPPSLGLPLHLWVIVGAELGEEELLPGPPVLPSRSPHGIRISGLSAVGLPSPGSLL